MGDIKGARKMRNISGFIAANTIEDNKYKLMFDIIEDVPDEIIALHANRFEELYMYSVVLWS